MNISLIAAISINKAIGFKNRIPWILSTDLAWFRKNTLNKPVVMGRITYESIGNPLDQRLNIILSHTYLNNDNRIIWVHSINEVLDITESMEETMIIGGGKIYELFLPYANKIYLTHVDINIIGDVFFPNYKSTSWKTVFIEYHRADKKNTHNYRFEILERLK
ncbi:Dihydrofolate reductase [Candidatus Arsenophonus lipoptenae]|uniref:Dihydrofolate reductase n=1 Tax=Candidatus Arsenophonus lipoptenae TaxID=634113 RepID=A0A0X9WAQ9_9GAMM|nr:type 3 dihydrofolate reductase [Candidatus Arsenophonus lipoptenae]AMA64973.1 Dihydrofolate reductase [Candidatus Arsenophonus lipoptenae]